MSASLRCPNCKNKLLHKSSGKMLVRSAGPILVGEDGLCKAKCHFCKHEVSLPLELTKSARQSIDVRFVITES